jgi:predicted nucleic acid-binding protein
MLVADTSALASLAAGEVLELALAEFDVHTTETVVAELEETAGYDDEHGAAASRAVDCLDHVTIHEVSDPSFAASRVDHGEGSCVQLARDGDATFLLTDDLRALPELQALTDADVAISPIALRALVKQGVLSNDEASERLDRIAETRDWLGAPIYRRAQHLLE